MSGTTKSKGRSGGGSASPGKKDRKNPRGSVGRALRTVYDDMLREDIPKDFLDLLGKLD